MITVPSSDGMDSETFRKHLELRHIPVGDFSDLKHFKAGSGFAADRPTFEIYHTHLHERKSYEHDHS